MSIVAPPGSSIDVGSIVPVPGTDRRSHRPSSAPAEPSRQRRPVRRGWPWWWLALVGILLLVIVGWTIQRPWGGPSDSLVLYTVHPVDLNITVTERGNLESLNDLKILCEVDDVPGDGISGTPLAWIVPNGSSVGKGDLLVEFDSSSHQERLDSQILDTDRARSLQIQAEVKYENQQTQNETALAEAKLKVDLAKLAVEQYEDEDGGTFQMELNSVEQQIREAQANQLIERTNLAGVEQLYRLGYRSSGELAQARLSYLRAERELATAVSRKKELVDYQYRKTKMQLAGELASAVRALRQVERDNEALLTQAKAALESANEQLQKEEERLARYSLQVERCKIYAPQDGMVAYAASRNRYYSEDIRAGVPIRERQQILSLPNLDYMQVKTAVHESVLESIQEGLAATISVDAFADRRYDGSVASVAVLPDQGGWLSSDTKVYETVVTIDEKVEQLKPGMTAVVEIHVDHLKDVLAVPVQAVVQVDKATWCYVRSGSEVQKRLVALGKTNDKFVHVVSGLLDGDQVVLNPSAVLQREKHTPNQAASL